MHLAVRLLLAWFALFGLVVGSWQAFLPASFYRDFPGSGHRWVSPDGPYNEHLMRDVGALTTALGVVALVALLWTTTATIRVAAAGALVSSVPHFIYHLIHLDLLPTTADQVVQTLTLAVAPLAAVVLLWTAARLEAPGAQGRSREGRALHPPATRVA